MRVLKHKAGWNNSWREILILLIHLKIPEFINIRQKHLRIAYWAVSRVTLSCSPSCWCWTVNCVSSIFKIWSYIYICNQIHNLLWTGLIFVEYNLYGENRDDRSSDSTCVEYFNDTLMIYLLFSLLQITRSRHTNTFWL